MECEEGTYIAIGNQFFKSNHDHFGKLFTYATMFLDGEKTVTDVVWIVEKYAITYASENMNYVKIAGLFPANIENEANWSLYKEKAIDLLTMIVKIADMVPRC